MAPQNHEKMARQPVINKMICMENRHNFIIPLIFCLVFGYQACFGQHHDHPNHKHQHKHQHEWNMTAEDMVKEFNDPERDVWQKPYEVISQFGDIENKTIMDLGAGAGYFSFKLAEKGAAVIAADLQAGYLDFIEKTAERMHLQHKITTKLVTSNSAHLAPEEVDGILMVHVYHHIENRVDYFKEVWKQLGSGGQLLILETPPTRCPDAPPPSHFRLTPDQIRQELKEAGFQHFEANTTLLECQVVYLVTK